MGTGIVGTEIIPIIIGVAEISIGHQRGIMAISIVVEIFTVVESRVESKKALLIGSGSFMTTAEGEQVTGIAYTDAKGTLKEDNSNNPVLLSLNGKMGGGCPYLDTLTTFSYTCLPSKRVLIKNITRMTLPLLPVRFCQL